ncbi:MAG: glycosyltransferase [Candidatus Altiarchaeales archaeon]|nr:glycosyltransferase [Candidatus Altiarchaeales archaeon]
MMNLSIVTGTLNRRDFLPGLLHNTVYIDERIELIVVDGGSTDGTLEYLSQQSCDRLKVIEIGKRSSYPHFMNEGLRISSHEYVCQWNDDVLMASPWDVVFDVLKEPYNVFIFHWARGTLEDACDLNAWRCKTKKWIVYCGPDAYCMNFGVYRKNVFREVGMYSPSYQYYHADRDMTERARLFKKTVRECPEIQVLELRTAKRARVHIDDENILKDHLAQYRRGIIPTHIEMLT